MYRVTIDNNIVVFLIYTFFIDNASSNVISENEQKEYRSNRFSIGFHLLLPVAGLSLLILGRRQIFENILLQLDRKYLSVICPSFIKKENILKWANSRLPPTWSSPSTKTLSGGIKELWIDGSLLCTLINTAIPGACPNPHRHWKQSPVHGQNLAYKYFGIVPIFTEEDLKRSFNSSLERKFIPYLNRIQNSVNKVSESIEKETKISSRYIVRGMGLFSGEQHKEATFYIYLNEEYEDDGDKEENIIIQIKGPFGTYGEVVAPKIVNKKRKRINKRKEGRRQSIQFIENFIQSNTWNFTRAQRKNVNDGIDIETMMEKERIRVTYTPTDYGMYEINMLCGTELVKGCPFNVHIFINELGKNTEMKKEIYRKHRKPVKKIETNILPNLVECEEIKKSVKLKAVKILNVEETSKNILDTSPKTETSNLNILHIADNTNEKEVTAKAKETVFEPIECSDLGNKKVDNDLEVNFLDDSKNSINNNSYKHLLNVDGLTKSNKTENIKISQNVETVKTNDGKELTEKKANNSEAKIVEEISTPSNENLDTDITDGSSKINTINRPSIFANKNIINTSENSQMERNHKSFTIKPKYINNLHVDKIKIPEMFTVDTMKDHTLEDKHFKNIFNESNKVTKQNSSHLEAEDFQKYRQVYSNFEINKIENKLNGGSNIYSQTLPKYNQDTFFLYHSPEEESIAMTAAEKRNKFSKTKSSKGAFSSRLQNSSLTDENKKHLVQETEPSKAYSPAQQPLKIQKLTYPNDNSIETCSLCSTASLPNLSMDSDYSFVMSVKDRKQFWENYSPRSLSSNSTKSLSPKKIRNLLSETERSKLIWSKSKDDSPESVYPIENISKSADDILSLANLNEDCIKYNSTKDSLDNNYEFLSIKERKLRLLKKFNRNENTSEKKQNRSEIIKNKTIKSLDEPKDLLEKGSKNIHFTPLSDKIRKYHSALELSTKPTTDPSTSNIKNISASVLPKAPNAVTTENTLKVYSHFKKAINYFKKLESQSPDKIVNKPKRKIKRANDRKDLPSYKSGSLNIPKISQKFFINNLYKDVFGNKSNFKGTPNKSAVVEALATFPRNRSKFYDNEDNIEYDIFKKVTKTRKRKSLKSIFDIHY